MKKSKTAASKKVAQQKLSAADKRKIQQVRQMLYQIASAQAKIKKS